MLDPNDADAQNNADEMSAEFDRDALLREFQRNGGGGAFTRACESALPVGKSAIGEADCEKCVLQLGTSTHAWGVLTTSHIVFLDRRLSIDLSEIADVRAEFAAMEKVSSIDSHKWTVIRVVLFDGTIHDLTVESGPAYLALLSVLTYVGGRNHRARRPVG